MATHAELARDIFGGSDSELSSDDEEEIQKQPPRRPQRESPPAEEYESSGGDSGDEYVQERKAPVIKPKKRVRRRADGDEEERATGQKKRKRRPAPEINLDDLPPQQANKMRLDMQIEAILKPKKASRIKRKKKDEDDVGDRVADEEVARLRDAMVNAAMEDAHSNSNKLPATAKLRLLPQVMEVLRKASLAQAIVDNNLLEGVRRWLEPLPDRSLPALNIQREFFPVLKKMEYIDSAVLKESGLGRVVLFYTKCKRVTPDIAKLADELVSTWSRPIIKRSASYRDRIIPVAQDGDSGGQRSGERLNAILARAKESEKHRVRKNAVMIPQRELGSYTVAPKDGLSKGNTSVDVDVERRRKNAERLRTLTRKMTGKT